MLRAGIVVLWVKLPLVMLVSHMLVLVLAALFPIYIPAIVPGKAEEDSSSTWIPSTHVGDQYGVPGSWLWLSSALAVVTT